MIKKIITFIGIYFLVLTLQAQDDLPAIPDQLVNDQIGFFSAQEIRYFEHKLVAYDDTTSTQIALLVVDDLKGYSIVDYAQRVAEKWKIGRKGKDNGVIIVLKPKIGNQKGEVNIDVGYGLEPIIPDATAKRIIEQEMIPRFKNNDYAGGVDAARNVILGLASGQFSSDGYGQGRANNPSGCAIALIVFIIVITMINRGKRNNTTFGGGKRRSSLPLWTALWLGSSMGRGGGGSWGNFSGGSGGFGGGGGFGGFGGGSFGGGGASGSW